MKMRQLYKITSTSSNTQVFIDIANARDKIILDSILFAADQSSSLNITVQLKQAGQIYNLPAPSASIGIPGQKVEYGMVLFRDDIIVITLDNSDAGKNVSMIVNYSGYPRETG